MGADMKRTLIKLYDKLHLSQPMWSVEKICVEISEIRKLKKVFFYHSKKRQRLQLRTYFHLLTMLI
jgi:hypothetical protein